MSRKHTIGLIWMFSLGIVTGRAQEVWTLKQCIDHAIENNLTIKQGALNADIARQDMIQAKADLLPILNGFASNNYSFGRAIDPFTNQFVTDRVRTNSFSLSASMTLFDGLRKMNTIKQTQLNFEAGKYASDKIRNDISLSIAAAYLQVLLAEELEKVASSQLIVTNQQVKRTGQLLDAGTVARGALLDVEAQQATEELNLVNAVNQRELGYLTLKQLLDLEPDMDMKVARPLLNVPQDISVEGTPGQLYDAAQRSLPQIRNAELQLLSAEKTVAIARSGMSPTLSLSAGYGTGFSELRQDLLDVSIDGYMYSGAYTQGSNDSVLAPIYNYQYETTPFAEQIDNNVNQTVGFNLTIPIFNGLQTRTNINKAKINMENSQLNLQIARNNLRKEVHQAYADAVAALKRYRATKKQENALTESFNYMEQRFNVGMVTSVDYNDAKNKLTRAQSDLLQAKYQYVFNSKVLDFYQGKALAF